KKGQESEVGIRDYIDKNGGHPREEHPGVFFARNTFNKIQQSLYDHLCHGLTFAGDKFHFTSTDVGQTHQHDDRKPRGNECVRDREAGKMEYSLRRKGNMWSRYFEDARWFLAQKTGSERTKYQANSEED
ncbi:MAG: hypothetical protein QME90_13200, partial [Thermodesulfobacteriota bacterium]|nr:hypothetical protein [Thermodesulfobacteriota bacterium]